jgi:hypothetical protein
MLTAPPPTTSEALVLVAPDDAHDAAYSEAPASASTYSGAALQREPLDRRRNSGFTFTSPVEVD